MKLAPFLALTAALLAGCASVSVKGLQQNGSRVTKPQHIYVAPFSTSGSSFKIAGVKTGADDTAFREKTAAVLADYTVQNVSKHVTPAAKVASPTAAPATGWLVTGRFLRVNSGNRGMRMVIGLGAGGSKMETAVEVFDLAVSRAKPFLAFKTTGGSNAMPGLVTSGGPGVGAAYNMLMGATSGVTDDAARTSRMITGALSEYYVERGWLPKQKAFKTKKPGEYQLIHGM